LTEQVEPSLSFRLRNVVKIKPQTTLFLVGLACVCLSVGVLILLRTTGADNSATPPGVTDPFAQAKAQAFDLIEKREHWPESPQGVCEAFWNARRKKDYDEMHILWPGTASLNWAEICKNDGKTVHVFGEPAADGKTVPYAEKSHFETHGAYNLTMRLDVLDTDKGARYYIVSGN